MNYTFEAIVQI